MSLVSLIYHLSKKFKGGEMVAVKADKPASPQMDNDSIDKL